MALSNVSIIPGLSDMLPDMTIPDDTETYRDVTIGTTLNKYQRQSLWTLCEKLLRHGEHKVFYNASAKSVFLILF
jgi:hypothetical protein